MTDPTPAPEERTVDPNAPVQETDEERHEREARESEENAVGEDGYRRDPETGAPINPEDNEYAIVADSEGTVVHDPNK